jgi:hypothetical protein
VPLSVHLFIHLAFSNILRTSSNYSRGRQDKNALYCLQQYIGSGAVTGPLFTAVTFTILCRKKSRNEKRRCRLEKSQSNLKSVHFRIVFENLFKLATARLRDQDELSGCRLNGPASWNGTAPSLVYSLCRTFCGCCHCEGSRARLFLLANLPRMLAL